MEIFPSLISSNLLNLEKSIKILNDFCDGYHLDIMDDHFVPNLTWGPAFINSIAKVTDLPLQVHLMVDNPTKWVDRLNLKPKDYFIFHLEVFNSQSEIFDLIKYVKSKKVKIGIALNPKTELNNLFSYLNCLDTVLVMSVEPGFSGQKFMPEILTKVESLIDKKNSDNLEFKVAVDGGIDNTNVRDLDNLGVDQFCVASAIFNGNDPVINLKMLYGS